MDYPHKFFLCLAKDHHVDILSRKFSILLDGLDPLTACRNQFHIPLTESILNPMHDIVDQGDHQRQAIYMAGNSLGLQPKQLKAELNRRALDGMAPPRPNEFEQVEREACHLASKLVGAAPDEVVIANTLSFNLHLLLSTFYQPEGDKCLILLEKNAFSSDYFCAESQIDWRGLIPFDCIEQLEPREGECCLTTEDIITRINQLKQRLALILLPGVQYITGQAFDIEAITKAGHDKAKCSVIWDLAHSIGNMPLELDKWQVDAAVWCSYKYLNAGPGAIGGLFVNSQHTERHFWRRSSGDDSTFKAFSPISLIQLTSCISAMRLIDDCGGMQVVRCKSILLTGYLEFLLESSSSTHDPARDRKVKIITPKTINSHGSQLTLLIEVDCVELVNRLKHHGCICDARGPHCIRVAPVALYNTFEDVFAFVETLFKLLASD